MNELKFFKLMCVILILHITVNESINQSAGEEIENKKKNAKKSVLNVWKLITLMQLIRFVFATVCVAYFCYNASVIIGQYLKYNTIVTLRLQPPNETDLPAFTICGPFIVRPDYLVSTFKSYRDHARKLALSSKEGSGSQEEEEFQNMTNRYEEEVFKQKTALYIFDNLSIDVDDIVISCFFRPQAFRDRWAFVNNVKINCSQISPVVKSIYAGRKCFTFFSRLYSHNDKYNESVKMVYEKNPSVSFRISGHFDEWNVGPIQEATIMATLHSPDVIPTQLDYNYFRIYPNVYYDIHFSKKIEFLKPPPYKTHCRNYLRTDSKGLCTFLRNFYNK